MFNNERLRRLRKEAGLIQADMAVKLNIKRETYVRYETGTITPPADMIKDISDLFETTTDYLLNKTDDPRLQKKKQAPNNIWLEEDIKNDPTLSEESKQIMLSNLKLVKILDGAKALNEKADEETPKLRYSN
jgi:transcriptional regulator with XRE-family HTH domain